MFQKHINIFLSSTFQDMQAERDCLKTKVLPRLRDELLQYGITVSMTDLRWGVDTTNEEESKREAKVLRVCLDAIKRDRPYFVGMIGGRYGWVPPIDRVEQMVGEMQEHDRKLLHNPCGRSVTEMEMLFGALGSSDVLPHSYFFFRKPEVYATIPEEFRSRYVENDETAVKKLESLRRHINDICRHNGFDKSVQCYDARWDSEKECLTALEDFGDKVYISLLNDILESNGKNAYVSERDYEQRSFESFVTQRLDGFCGRREIVSFLEDFLLEFDPLDINRVNGYFLSGLSGCGKSSVFCKVYSDLSAVQDKNRLVILAHAAGITEDSCNPDKMIEKWIMKLELLPEISQFKSVGTGFDLFSILGNLLLRAICVGYKPIIMMDSYDSLKFEPWNSYMDTRMKNLSFIPFNVPFICTTLPGFVEPIIDYGSCLELLEMKSFSEDEALELIDCTLNVKKLSQAMIDSILSKRQDDGTPAYSSPLWLRMALSILDELGDKNFQEVNKEKFKRDDLKIASYLERLIQSFSPDVSVLFRQYIDLSCNYFKPELVKTSLLCAAISSIGVSESELELIIPSMWDNLEFQNLTMWMRSFVRQNPITKRWILEHNILKNIVKDLDVEITSELLGKYIDVLSNLEDEDSVLELIYQVISNHNYELFYVLLRKLITISDGEVGFMLYEATQGKISMDEMRMFFVKVIAYGLNYKKKSTDVVLIVLDWLNSTDTEVNFKKNVLKDILNNFFCGIIGEDEYTFKSWLCLNNELFKVLDFDEFEARYPEFIKICIANMDCLIKQHPFDIEYEFLRILCLYSDIPHKRNFLWNGQFKCKLSCEGTKRWLDVLKIIKSCLHIFKREQKIKIIKDIKKYFDENFYSTEDLYTLNMAVYSIERSLCLSDVNLGNPNGIEGDVKMTMNSGFLKIFKELYDKSHDEEKIDCWKKINVSLAPIEQCRQLLRQFLATQIKNSSNDNYVELAKLHINLANIFVTFGEESKAFDVMHVCSGICLNHFVFLPYTKYYESIGACEKQFVSFNLGDEHVQSLIDIADWYVSTGQVDTAVLLLEKAYFNSRISLAFFSDCDALRRLISKYQSICSKFGVKEERIPRVLGEYLEFVLRQPLLLCKAYVDGHVGNYVSWLRSIDKNEMADEVLSRYSNFNYESQFETIEDTDDYISIRNYKNGYLAVAIPGLYEYYYIWGYADNNGKVIVPPKYNEAGYFSEGLAMVGRGEGDRKLRFGAIGMKYGYIDVNGNEVIPLDYDYASAFYKGEAIVSKDGEFFYIDTNGCKTRAFNAF